MHRIFVTYHSCSHLGMEQLPRAPTFDWTSIIWRPNDANDATSFGITIVRWSKPLLSCFWYSTSVYPSSSRFQFASSSYILFFSVHMYRFALPSSSMYILFFQYSISLCSYVGIRLMSRCRDHFKAWQNHFNHESLLLVETPAVHLVWAVIARWVTLPLHRSRAKGSKFWKDENSVALLLFTVFTVGWSFCHLSFNLSYFELFFSGRPPLLVVAMFAAGFSGTIANQYFLLARLREMIILWYFSCARRGLV